MTSPRSAATILTLMLALGGTARGQWRQVGGVTPAAPQANSMLFRGSSTTAAVTVLAPDLVRVRIAPGASFGPDYSYAVIKTDWPRTPVEFSSGHNAETLRTSELEVRIQLDPFRVAFYDRTGRLISKDDDRHGTAWSGNEVRNWRWMPADEHYFGLGEKAGPLDRRGRSFVMWNTDAFGWGLTTDPLYIDIPFFIGLRQGKAYGIFFDNTWRSSFDFGVAAADRLSFGAENGEMNYYFFAGPDPKQVIERFTELVGRMPLPAKWAIGYHQSRYSYYPAKVVRFIADNFRLRHIPCDALFLDIHYMDGYRIFTWDKSRFPDPPELLRDLHYQGFHVVTIIDPGVKVDPNYWVYQQGLAGNDFVKMPGGSVFNGKVWPGESAFPDFTSPNVRHWWGSLYKGLMADGVDGFWNDMNEPSVFDVPSKTMPLDAVFYDHGLRSPQAKTHNVYGMEMSRGTEEGMLTLAPDSRPLVITRDTYAGGQRYAAVWTGDNSSTWDQLAVSLPEIMDMGLSGLTLAGADIGGFALDPSPELYTRWLEAGVFYPYCRTHHVLGGHDQEPWSFGNRLTDVNRQSIELRYRLMPYLYNAFHDAAETGLPVMRALLLDYPDDSEAVAQDHEFLFGDDLLVAPVVRSDVTRWDVYLPKGVWYDFWTDRQYSGPTTVTVDTPLDRIPIFVRGGAIVPTQQVVQYIGQAPINPLTFEVYPLPASTGPAASPVTLSRDYYEDDGHTLDYQRGVSMRERVAAERSAAGIELDVSARQGPYTPPARSLVFEIHGVRTKPSRVEANGQSLDGTATLDALSRANRGWAYDEWANVVRLKVPDSSVALRVKITE